MPPGFFVPMRFLRLISFALLLSLCHGLIAQMTPNAPVKNFRLPRFGENGYTDWVLQGDEGIYDSDEQVRVKKMGLRVYSGDERMARELTLDSPEATLRLQENRAFSDSAIAIVGENFTISGIGWDWSGATKEIVVKANAVVKYTDGFSGALLSSGEVSEAAVQTQIQSDRLVLRTTETDYFFEFTGSVQVNTDTRELKSEQLTAFVDAPEGRDAAEETAIVGELNSIRHIIAREQVVIVQSGRTVNANEGEFFPREQRGILRGDASVDMKGAYLSGHSIVMTEGEIVIAGADGLGRAQMILTETGGLGIQGASALASETIVLADSIKMQEVTPENHFRFDGSVEVLSGALRMQSAKMKIVANQSNKLPDNDSRGEADSEELKVGDVKSLVADGGVRIEQGNQVATGETVTFFPSEERALLVGDPRVTNGEAIVTGDTMELKPKLAIIRSDSANAVAVRLHEMPDLGYEVATPSTGGAPTEPKVDYESTETVIKSRLLRMIEKPGETLFRFTDDVEVSGTNLLATCDRMDVIAKEKPSISEGEKATLDVERIEAHENVVVKQSGRVATAEKAFILPKEEKIVLEENAVVTSDRGQVTGHRMTLYQGEGRAVVEPGVAEGERARIELKGFPTGK